ncbi:unnamed protein product [Ixodes pacificus]
MTAKTTYLSEGGGGGKGFAFFGRFFWQSHKLVKIRESPG